MNARQVTATCLLGLWSQLAFCEGVREDFAYAMAIQTQPGAALHRLTVPVEVYLHAVRSDLGDLRVLNAAGEVVPYALRAPVAETVQPRAGVNVAYFPLQGDPVAATQALRLTIRATDAQVELRGAESMDRTAPVSAYLIDARALTGPIQGLRLQWAADTPDFSTTVTIEAGETLVDWTTVDAAAPLVSLTHAGQRLVRDRLEFTPRQAKFWRVRWPQNREAVALQSVEVRPADTRVETPRLQVTVPLARASRERGDWLQYEADLGASLPVERFAVVFPQPNTVAQMELRALEVADAAEAGRVVWQGVGYRLQSGDGEVTSSPQSVPRTRARHWTLRVPRDGGGLGSGDPQLMVEWLAHEVVFAARGSAPYELVYGSGSAQSAAVPLAAFASAQASGHGGDAVTANTGAQSLAGGPARLEVASRPVNWRTIVLWSLLAVSVALLGWMALRLSRQMAQRPEK